MIESTWWLDQDRSAERGSNVQINEAINKLETFEVNAISPELATTILSLTASPREQKMKQTDYNIVHFLKESFARVGKGWREIEASINRILDVLWLPGWGNTPGLSPVVQWLDGRQDPVSLNHDYLDSSIVKIADDTNNTTNESVTSPEWWKEVLLDYADLREAVLVLRAVNHSLRQRIIDLLEESEGITVTDIYIKLRLEQSVASQHLAILRKAGVVRTERNGKFIYYSLDKNRLKQISKVVNVLADQ